MEAWAARGSGGGGCGDFTKAGAGALTLAGLNTYMGQTTVAGGTLNIPTGGDILRQQRHYARRRADERQRRQRRRAVGVDVGDKRRPCVVPKHFTHRPDVHAGGIGQRAQPGPKRADRLGGLLRRDDFHRPRDGCRRSKRQCRVVDREPGRRRPRDYGHLHAGRRQFAVVEQHSAPLDQEVVNLPEVGIGAIVPVVSEVGSQEGEFAVSCMDGGDSSQPVVVYLYMDASSTPLLNTDFTISGATDTHTTVEIDGGACEVFKATIPAGSNTTMIDVAPINLDISEGGVVVTMSLEENAGYQISGVGSPGWADVAIDDDYSANPIGDPGGSLFTDLPDGRPDPYGQVTVGDFEPLVVFATPTRGGTYTLDYNPTYFRVTSDEAGQNLISPETTPLNVPTEGGDIPLYLWAVADSTGVGGLTVSLDYSPEGGGDDPDIAETPVSAKELHLYESDTQNNQNNAGWADLTAGAQPKSTSGCMWG